MVVTYTRTSEMQVASILIVLIHNIRFPNPLDNSETSVKNAELVELERLESTGSQNISSQHNILTLQTSRET